MSLPNKLGFPTINTSQLKVKILEIEPGTSIEAKMQNAGNRLGIKVSTLYDWCFPGENKGFNTISASSDISCSYFKVLENYFPEYMPSGSNIDLNNCLLVQMVKTHTGHQEIAKKLKLNSIDGLYQFCNTSTTKDKQVNKTMTPWLAGAISQVMGWDIKQWIPTPLADWFMERAEETSKLVASEPLRHTELYKVNKEIATLIKQKCKQLGVKSKEVIELTGLEAVSTDSKVLRGYLYNEAQVAVFNTYNENLYTITKDKGFYETLKQKITKLNHLLYQHEYFGQNQDICASGLQKQEIMDYALTGKVPEWTTRKNLPKHFKNLAKNDRHLKELINIDVKDSEYKDMHQTIIEKGYYLDKYIDELSKIPHDPNNITHIDNLKQYLASAIRENTNLNVLRQHLGNRFNTNDILKLNPTQQFAILDKSNYQNWFYDNKNKPDYALFINSVEPKPEQLDLFNMYEGVNTPSTKPHQNKNRFDKHMSGNLQQAADARPTSKRQIEQNIKNSISQNKGK